ncbi:carboxymuconolactone decarboxylase [Catenulispora acidiphila DSM 44928]|uniref:Carboxymuconolactone decarboxylase n=1 Tax=Catenulispora acidiphila (strain DSM 44928 / JCM 14897 / NBRC 102108 / NRRL B-24433 / ID139908) TaxID=479433 RepID=C7QB22_CATAD|nr:carboxymuconolactone decarboxylase family protein [Catenulispora acidiphila]ACU76313.1 carboxymuconolactone decarboxylase [Catenulispora acidiphila DSM 44928]
MAARIPPLSPPYSAEAADLLDRMMPGDQEPIALFRTFARNLPMAEALHVWGSHVLSRRLTLTLRDREILIDRTCARCGCEYEWGVHIAHFADRAALTGDQITALTHGTSADPCWTTDRDRLLLDAADALHDENDIDDALWTRLAAEFTDDQLLDLLLVCGWYHAISFTARAARLPLEPGAARFETA